LIARLTPESRKFLLIAEGKQYTKETELIVEVEEIDFAKNSIRVKVESGEAISASIPKHFIDKARMAGGRSNFGVLINGIGVFDTTDKLQKFIETRNLEVIPHPILVRQLDEIYSLEDGWLDGQGKAADKNEAEWFFENFLTNYPDGLPYPQCCLTPSGNLFFEWIIKPKRLSLEIVAKEHRAELQMVDTAKLTFTDEEIILSDENKWNEVFASIQRLLG
jgi:hypothetical protein